MKNFKSIILLACSLSLLIGCAEEPDEVKPTEKQKEVPAYEYKDDGVVIEEYITAIDDSSTLIEGNSLFYSRPGGESYEVKFRLNENSEILKMTEMFTTREGGSIESSSFYYRDNALYASKEYFEEGTGDAAYFTERVSYYDKDGEVLVTKSRKAPFEDLLNQETFALASKHKCSDAKALRALNQEEEFETNFRGFVDDGPLRYLMVGENKPGGFETALLIQDRTAFLLDLYLNQDRNMGMELKVNFETKNEATGYTYQALIYAVEVIDEKK